MAWLSFIELDKAVVRVIRLASASINNLFLSVNTVSSHEYICLIILNKCQIECIADPSCPKGCYLPNGMISFSSGKKVDMGILP